MEEYKSNFIRFLLDNNALKVSEGPDKDFTLKSKRLSPWFVNIGDFNDGSSTKELGKYYARTLIHFSAETGRTFQTLYGIPDHLNENLYDIVIDATYLSPEQVFKEAIFRIQAYLKKPA